MPPTVTGVRTLVIWLALPVATIALAGSLGVADAAPSPAVAVRPHAPGAVAFWSSEHGIAASRGHLWTTTDGGRTWSRRARVRSVSTIAVADGANAWVIAKGRLLASTDGGRTFVHAATPRGGLTDVSFPTATLGWAVRSASDRSRLVGTVDGGGHWTRVGDPCDGLLLVSALRVSRAAGFALCVSEGGAGNEGKRVLATANGGRSWRVRAEVPFGAGQVDWTGLGNYGYPVRLAGVASSLYLSESRGRDFTSGDGGRHWIALMVQRPEVDFTTAIATPTTTTTYVLLRNGDSARVELHRSDGGGRRWRLVATFPGG